MRCISIYNSRIKCKVLCVNLLFFGGVILQITYKKLWKMLIDRDSYMMLVYKFVHKLKHREIAKIMGLTTSIVTNKISRSLKTLKEKMKNEK